MKLLFHFLWGVLIILDYSVEYISYYESRLKKGMKAITLD